MAESTNRFRNAAVITSVVVADQATKRWAAVSLSGQPRQSFLNDLFRLEYAENSGAFLGLGQSLPPNIRTLIFVFGVSAVLISVAVMLKRQQWAPLPRLGLWLVLAGGVSNLIDRVARGRVIDFLNLGVGPVRTGIFNVADMALMLGLGFVLFAGQARAQPDRAAEVPSEGS